MINQFNDHAANERTFLAWVRTSMALVGFGLAIAHLRDKEIGPVPQAALVGIGLLVVAISYLRMHVLTRRIEDAAVHPYAAGVHGALFAASVVALLALVAVFGWHVA